MTRRLLLVLAMVLGSLGSIGITASPAAASPAVQYTNSLVAQRADPHVFKHSDGFYYYTATVPQYVPRCVAPPPGVRAPPASTAAPPLP